MASPAPTPTHIPDAADTRPMYILLTLAVLLNGYFFFVGTVCVRLWFYEGALGPEPEKFIILRKDLKERYRKSLFPGSDPGPEPTITTKRANKRATIFPSIAPPENNNDNNTGQTKILDLTAFSPLPKISLHKTDLCEPFTDPTITAYIHEERRISRLPTFTQDDCGDGSDFPNIPLTNTPIEPPNPLTTPLTHTSAHAALNLTPTPESEWLVIDNAYIPQHTTRASLLATQHSECIQCTPDGEAACEELLEEVVHFLTLQYPQHFRITTKRMRRHVRNELTGEEFALKRPWDAGGEPLEVVARLCGEDFQVWGWGEFTGGWYLQASATLFPAGWHMRKHIGKSLDLIVNNMNEPMPMWEDLPTILSLPSLTHHAFNPTPLSTTTLYIQTLPSPTTPPILHTRHPIDFFPGTLSNLLPSTLLLRTQHTTFRRLQRTGAIVMSSRTRTRRLVDVVDEGKKRGLVGEVRGWGEDEARFKGRDLWWTSFRGWCEGRPVWRDDGTVWSGDSGGSVA